MWVSPHLLKFTIYFVGSGGQLSWVFDLRPLSYLEHCCIQSVMVQISGSGGGGGGGVCQVWSIY